MLSTANEVDPLISAAYVLYAIQTMFIQHVLHKSKLQEPARLNARARIYIDEYKGAQT